MPRKTPGALRAAGRRAIAALSCAVCRQPIDPGRRVIRTTGRNYHPGCAPTTQTPTAGN
ncbi:hypothetical protein [Pseudofrankia sp. DC12]|uniref:hypothetical protein n=1 Tax=Pseudofrankia sp. DC12 TaxID=683315 RepID=UPI000ACCB0F0|nr:hypothetical protein [Pseudofrankia sp. DC12]